MDKSPILGTRVVVRELNNSCSTESSGPQLEPTPRAILGVKHRSDSPRSSLLGGGADLVVEKAGDALVARADRQRQ